MSNSQCMIVRDKEKQKKIYFQFESVQELTSCVCVRCLPTRFMKILFLVRLYPVIFVLVQPCCIVTNHYLYKVQGNITVMWTLLFIHWRWVKNVNLPFLKLRIFPLWTCFVYYKGQIWVRFCDCTLFTCENKIVHSYLRHERNITATFFFVISY